jgi:hypothetical protein
MQLVAVAQAGMPVLLNGNGPRRGMRRRGYHALDVVGYFF